MHPLTPHLGEILPLNNIVAITIEDGENHLGKMFREFHAGHHIRDVSQSFWGDIRPSEVVKGQLIIHNTHILHKAKKGQELLQTYTTTHVSKLFLDPLQGFACFATGSSEAQNHLGKVQFGDHSSGNHKSEYIPKFLNLQTTFTWNPLTGSRTAVYGSQCATLAGTPESHLHPLFYSIANQRDISSGGSSSRKLRPGWLP